MTNSKACRPAGIGRADLSGPKGSPILLPIRLLLATIGGLILSSSLSAGDGAVSVDGTRLALDKWVETRRIISRERSDWKLGRELLQERTALVEREIGSLRQRVSEAQGNVVASGAKRDELLAENRSLKGTTASMLEAVVALEQRTLQLLRQLPEPITKRVAPLSQRIPESGVDARLSLSERFQSVVGILNEVDKFNHEITVTSEVRELPDGSSAEVATLYAGIGQGWYCSGSGLVAGVGRATSAGWVWEAANDAADAIRQAIAMVENETVAGFVQLPVQLN